VKIKIFDLHPQEGPRQYDPKKIIFTYSQYYGLKKMRRAKINGGFNISFVLKQQKSRKKCQNSAKIRPESNHYPRKNGIF
jgi:hypothetical protein